MSFSSNDSVGHTYGPDSPQVRDIAIRTDAAIGRLLTEIDRAVGLSHVLVSFTTDHGVAPLPETLTERGLPGGRMTTKDLFDPIQRALSNVYGEGKWLMATAGSSPYLNYELIDSLKLDPAAYAARRLRRRWPCLTWLESTRATNCSVVMSRAIASAHECCAALMPSAQVISR